MIGTVLSAGVGQRVRHGPYPRVSVSVNGE